MGCELPPECIESKYMTVRKVVFRIRFRGRKFKTSHWLSNIETESNIKKYTRVYFVIRKNFDNVQNIFCHLYEFLSSSLNSEVVRASVSNAVYGSNLGTY